jgi:hypothetical protein
VRFRFIGKGEAMVAHAQESSRRQVIKASSCPARAPQYVDEGGKLETSPRLM